jgi:hypothetical protein
VIRRLRRGMEGRKDGDRLDMIESYVMNVNVM